ncbi:unnamed protein product [Rotaria sp. Silwood1]|nr:unnamed protein product [Rotaria sp. Silwood1]
MVNADSKVFDLSPRNHHDRTSIVTSIPAPSLYSTPHASKQQSTSNHNIVTNSNDQDNSTMNFPTPNVSTHHLSSDRITSAMDLRSSQYLSPSNQQQRTNKKSSEKQTLQTQSLTPNSLQRLPLINSQYNNQVQHTLIDKTEKRNNWINK